MTPLCRGKSIIMWGTCTSGPRVRTFDNGKMKTVFSLKYNQTKNDAGEKVSDYIDVEAWGNLAKYAACVERGDDLFVAGEYAKDNYRSEKKGEDIYVIKAAIILAQPIAEEMPEETEPEQPERPAETFTEVPEDEDGELPF